MDIRDATPVHTACASCRGRANVLFEGWTLDGPITEQPWTCPRCRAVNTISEAGTAVGTAYHAVRVVHAADSAVTSDVTTASENPQMRDLNSPLLHGYRPPPPPARTPGERIWTLTKGTSRTDCELRTDRLAGVEVQLLSDGELYIAKRFADRADAIAYGERHRVHLIGRGWG